MAINTALAYCTCRSLASYIHVYIYIYMCTNIYISSEFERLAIHSAINTLTLHGQYRTVRGTTGQPSPRCRKMPKRFDEGENLHRYLEPKGRYRHICFLAIEVVAGVVFDQPDLRVIKDLETLLLCAANGELHVGEGFLSDELSLYIKGNVDQAHLKV